MEWKDQIWEYPRRYKLQQNADSTVDIIPAKGQSIQDGTPVNAENLNKLIPKGLISMWSGSIANIPKGWALCDGKNGTPDLRNRFIVGAGSEYSVGATGGAKEVALTEGQMPRHRHTSGTLNAGSAGSHRHDISLGQGATGSSYNKEGIMGKNNIYINWVTNVSFTGSAPTNSTGSHSHSISGSTGYIGSGQAHENRPPYYALAFIMKL